MSSFASAAPQDVQNEAPEGAAGPSNAFAGDLAAAALSEIRVAARGLMRLSRFEAARPFWERVAATLPKDVEPRMALARIHARAERNADALAYLHEVLALQPEHEDAQRLRGKVARLLIEELSLLMHAAPQAAASALSEWAPHLADHPEFQRLTYYLENSSRPDAGPSLEAEMPQAWDLDLPDTGDDIVLRAQAACAAFHAGNDSLALAAVRELLEAHAPFTACSDAGDAALADVIRRLRAHVWRDRAIVEVSELERIAAAHDDGSARMHWILGMFASARLDAAAAEAHFARVPDGSGLFSPDLERALLHDRLHQYGEAYAALERLGGMARVGREYRSRLARLKKVVEFCGWRENLRYPGCLIDVIFEELDNGPLGYAPRDGHLLTVTSSLRPGGSERQTVTVLGGMARDQRLARIVLAIRSEDRKGERSFLHQARELPIEIVHYGGRWNEGSDALEALPDLRGRPQLVGAIELLPHHLREEIVRLCRLILEIRPQAVHLRQDLFAGAIACALAGVPRFLCHRGSLSPDRWGLGPFETHLYLRPMRHTYRKLLARDDFVIVNNSTAGAESDRAWTGWDDPSRFAVVYNAVEFDTLDRDAASGNDPRESLGIPQDAFLIAGIFRIEAVKRPRLWIDIARIVTQAFPQVHFVVLGGGTLAEEMRAHAGAVGLGGRLHMPGFVSNVAQWLKTIDLNLLTSDREGLPNVLIEGQHFGVPAVASDVGGAFETVEPGVTGMLVPSDAGAEAYADAVARIIGDEAWRGRARRRAPEFVHAKFGCARTVDEVLNQLGIGAREAVHNVLQSAAQMG